MSDSKTCSRCGVIFTRAGLTYRPSSAEWAARSFCGTACRDAQRAEELFKGRDATHPDSGRRVARLNYEATVCERCQATTSLVRHHRNEDTFDNRPENIEILCRSCHAKHHKTIIRSPEEERARYEHKRQLGREAEARYRERRRARA